MPTTDISSPETVYHGRHNHPRTSSWTQVENCHTQINAVSHSIDREYPLEKKRVNFRLSTFNAFYCICVHINPCCSKYIKTFRKLFKFI